MLAAYLVLLTSTTPIDYLVGKWSSIETVTSSDGTKDTIRLTGENRWVYPGKLLEIHEKFRLDSNKKEMENHILIRNIADGKLKLWWYVADRPEPIIFEGVGNDKGLTFDQKDGNLRIVYVWDTKNAYDAKLQSKGKDGEFKDMTIARYTRR